MPNPYDRLTSYPELLVTSQAVTTGEHVPLEQRSGIFGAGGSDISPDLSWSQVPPGTQSFVVSMYDPDAPTPSGFWHWMVADIPADCTGLPRDCGNPEGEGLPAGAVAVRNDSGMTRYIGCAPPAGTDHYYIAVHALDIPTLDVSDASTPPLLSFMMLGHVLGRGLLVPTCDAA